MSFLAHVGVFGLLIVDLLFGSFAVERLWSHWGAVGFEFAIILGYVMLVLQWWPWKRPDDAGPSSGPQ